MKILLELRPAFDGHSGIPQETRLLFRGLAGLNGVEVVGLIQSSNLVVEAGTPRRRGVPVEGLTNDQRIDRLSQVVVSLQQGPASHRLEGWRKRVLKFLGPAVVLLGSLLGRSVSLSDFDPGHFRDFIWRALFARTLPETDFEIVTSQSFRVLRWPWSIMNAWGVATAQLGRALYPRLDTGDIDLLIVETPYPGRASRRTRMVVRYHDAFPLLMPHTIKDRSYHRAMHYHALKRNAADGAWFACVSEATRQDLLSVLPELAQRAVTIPNMISHHFVAETAPATRVPEIIWSRKNRRAPHEGGAPINAQSEALGDWPFLLIVSTLEPRKNHLALLDAWELLRSDGYPQLNLVCVGGLGWEHEAILHRFSPWLRRGGVHLLTDVPSVDLRLLYRHARATVCPSLGEGFDFSGVEAMRCGGVVAASDIPVHREIFGQAAEYFSAYSAPDMAEAIGRVIAPDADSRREALKLGGASVSAQYLPERVMPQWQAFLQRLA